MQLEKKISIFHYYLIIVIIMFSMKETKFNEALSICYYSYPQYNKLVIFSTFSLTKLQSFYAYKCIFQDFPRNKQAHILKSCFFKELKAFHKINSIEALHFQLRSAYPQPYDSFLELISTLFDFSRSNLKKKRKKKMFNCF